MKLERINENQIRCTLNKNDLLSRHLKLSELAYGTEKAKALFREMMAQASEELGFEADDIPLVIEAIPVSSDCIVLIITKVEDPEELDTRFSKFAPSPGGDNDQRKKEALQKLEGAETLLNLLGKVKEKINAADTANDSMEKDSPEEHKAALRLFSFPTMDSVLRAVHLLSQMYKGSNTLYKDHEEGVYILALTQADYETRDFNRICNMLTEYGTLEKANGATLAFLEEHCEVLVSSNAVEKLAVI